MIASFAPDPRPYTAIPHPDRPGSATQIVSSFLKDARCAFVRNASGVGAGAVVAVPARNTGTGLDACARGRSRSGARAAGAGAQAGGLSPACGAALGGSRASARPATEVVIGGISSVCW
jgi:hypothetical protein